MGIWLPKSLKEILIGLLRVASRLLYKEFILLFLRKVIPKVAKQKENMFLL